jgi:hypothetical protein
MRDFGPQGYFLNFPQNLSRLTAEQPGFPIQPIFIKIILLTGRSPIRWGAVMPGACKKSSSWMNRLELISKNEQKDPN